MFEEPIWYVLFVLTSLVILWSIHLAKEGYVKFTRDRLTKAKELLKWALHSDPEHDDDFYQKWEEAEQFLKESEGYVKFTRDRLTKAKELLKWALHSDHGHDDDFYQKWEEAEQFLKESE